MNYFFFIVGLTLLIIHEMDAVMRQEWRMFGFLSRLPNEKAYLIFSSLHIPIFILIFLALFSSDVYVRTLVILGLDVFYIFHFVLHIAFRKHWNNKFTSAFSWLIIATMFLSGLLHIFFNLETIKLL